jgi:hypothetical protein
LPFDRGMSSQSPLSANHNTALGMVVDRAD